MDRNTDFLLRAVAAVRRELQAAIPDWSAFSVKFDACIAALEQTGSDDARNRLFELLATRPEALRLLLAELAAPVVETGAMTKGATPGAVLPGTQWVTVPIYYATDRAASGSADPNGFFTGERCQDEPPLQFGAATVSVPFHHQRGSLERPHWWKLELRENPEKHVTLLGVAPLGRAEYVERIRADLAETSETAALVFVHGFNVSFTAAARQMAQLAFDLEFRGVPLLYSWPSGGSVLQYLKDGTNVKWSEPQFAAFLALVMKDLGVKTVHIIAHSMGNRVVSETLKALPAPPPAPAGQATLTQVVFAAPDVDAGAFVQLAGMLPGKAHRYTLYASSRDVALAASHALNGYPRAGDSENLTIVPGVDTIDASDVDTSLFSLSHSYFSAERSILTDLFDLLKHGDSPDDRYGMKPLAKSGKAYWQYAP
jgi:esterase/lipase superfamily enzyme